MLETKFGTSSMSLRRRLRLSSATLVQARRFSELLDEAIKRYTNWALSTAEIIAALVELAKELRESKAGPVSSASPMTSWRSTMLCARTTPPSLSSATTPSRRSPRHW